MLHVYQGPKDVELFGEWQTTAFVPPIIENGKVPRNQYGSVDLFKPCMLPIGGIHLPYKGIGRTASRLGIDWARAHSYIAPLCFKMAQNQDLRCVLVRAP